MPPKLIPAFTRKALLGIFLVCAIAPAVSARPQTASPTPAIAVQTPQPALRCKTLGPGALFARTELYFGLSKSDGTIISDADFGNFIDQAITPRFPDGLTVLAGFGQFKNSAGDTIREPSRIVILFYPLGDKTNTKKLEAIRSAYKTAFQQESVLRTDDQTCVAF